MKKNWKEEQKARREQLKELSKSLKPLVEEGKFENLNAALVAYYKTQHPEIIELNTFYDWKQKGATIRKGEKAFIIWGQPRKLKGEQEANTAENEEKEESFFPICCLFSNAQVITSEEKEEHRKVAEQHASENLQSEISKDLPF